MAVGDDANVGTSEGSGNAWKTIDKAMNTVAAGDKVWVKASANYTELVTIDTVGSIAAPIVFEGYTSTTGDGEEPPLLDRELGLTVLRIAWLVARTYSMSLRTFE